GAVSTSLRPDAGGAAIPGRVGPGLGPPARCADGPPRRHHRGRADANEQGKGTVMTTDVQSEWTRPPEWQPESGRSVTSHRIGTREEWVAAREELVVREKEHTRQGDELARQRRELPWVRVEKEYRLDTDDGPRTLSELFDGRSQLLIYHFMFGPSYQAGCPINSSIADTI